MSFIWEGNLSKMRVVLKEGKVNYFLEDHFLNDGLSNSICLRFLNEFNCKYCHKVIKKTFGEGLCFKCFMSLPSADICIVKPERCHFNEGSCRDEIWGKANCFNDHIVYLAYSSGVKIGITRLSQVPTRWIDQGAILALPIMKVSNRKISGEIEQIFSEVIADKTNWRKMLMTQSSDVNLELQRELIYETLGEELDYIEDKYCNDLEILEEKQIELIFPVKKYPEKIKSVNFDKVNKIEGILQGIKGQYLIIDDFVINIRRHTGYKVRIEIKER